MATDTEGGSTGGVPLVRELYFPTFIYFRDLPVDAELNAALKEKIYSMRREDAVGLHRSNVKQTGAWHSQDDLHRQPEFGPLVAEILAAIQSVFNDLQYDPDYEPFIDNMWAYVSPKHAYNRTHTHPGVIWSGVYYVQTPENCGRIYFSDPRVQAQMLRPRIQADGRKEAHNWTEVLFDAREGRIVLFPAWLVHDVEPNLSDEQGGAGNRISISFNLIQRRRQSG